MTQQAPAAARRSRLPAAYLLGPAFVAAIAYVDPGNVAANVSAGSQFGFLLLWVIVRYRRGANPVASKTSHNTAIEIAWTLVPVLILVGIAVPSMPPGSPGMESPKPVPYNTLLVQSGGETSVFAKH